MSNREHIDENIKRKLYAESMGKCMNPNCQTELFTVDEMKGWKQQRKEELERVFT